MTALRIIINQEVKTDLVWLELKTVFHIFICLQNAMSVEGKR